MLKTYGCHGNAAVTILFSSAPANRQPMDTALAATKMTNDLDSNGAAINNACQCLLSAAIGFGASLQPMIANLVGPINTAMALRMEITANVSNKCWT